MLQFSKSGRNALTFYGFKPIMPLNLRILRRKSMLLLGIICFASSAALAVAMFWRKSRPGTGALEDAFPALALFLLAILMAFLGLTFITPTLPE